MIVDRDRRHRGRLGRRHRSHGRSAVGAVVLTGQRDAHRRRPPRPAAGRRGPAHRARRPVVAGRTARPGCLPRRPHSRSGIRRSRSRSLPGRPVPTGATRCPTRSTCRTRCAGPACGRAIRWSSTTPARRRPPPACGGPCAGPGTTTCRCSTVGSPAWVAAGRPVEPGEAIPPPGDIVVRPGQLPVLDAAGAAAVAAEGMLLDSRVAGRYARRARADRPGRRPHPGRGQRAGRPARRRRRARCARPTSCARIFAEAGVGDGPVGAYCGSGVTAANTVLALHLAGFTDAALYVGSWSNWVADPDRAGRDGRVTRERARRLDRRTARLRPRRASAGPGTGRADHGARP